MQSGYVIRVHHDELVLDQMSEEQLRDYHNIDHPLHGKVFGYTGTVSHAAELAKKLLEDKCFCEKWPAGLHLSGELEGAAAEAEKLEDHLRTVHQLLQGKHGYAFSDAGKIVGNYQSVMLDGRNYEDELRKIEQYTEAMRKDHIFKKYDMEAVREIYITVREIVRELMPHTVMAEERVRREGSAAAVRGDEEKWARIGKELDEGSWHVVFDDSFASTYKMEAYKQSIGNSNYLFLLRSSRNEQDVVQVMKYDTDWNYLEGCEGVLRGKEPVFTGKKMIEDVLRYYGKREIGVEEFIKKIDERVTAQNMRKDIREDAKRGLLNIVGNLERGEPVYLVAVESGMGVARTVEQFAVNAGHEREAITSVLQYLDKAEDVNNLVWEEQQKRTVEDEQGKKPLTKQDVYAADQSQMTCIRHDHMRDKTLPDLIGEVTRVTVLGEFKKGGEHFTKYSFKDKGNEDMFVLERSKSGKSQHKEVDMFHFKQDFKKDAALYFVDDFDRYQDQKNQLCHEHKRGGSRK